MSRKKKRLKEIKKIAEQTGYMPGSIDESKFYMLADWDPENIPQTVLGTHSLYCRSPKCDLNCTVIEDLMIVWQQATMQERRRCVDVATRHRSHPHGVGDGHCIADQIMGIDDPDPIL